ncbi:hypothetical protein TMatcc_001889 [Talaromyces marneffei ATCC 18224]|uniref:Uncharacterized protein n=1 Tax=Talaromyces marneffei (strain ATCC 18224 / CBS 334.59 / QM 7333) TaxID=441960 RepID=B6QI29_TALMQ|nr:uncharacterized protein EYB26_006920 [Talaromyces marneffei]EEA23024.1 hypothetical protein PMAA_096240 [Talaromyces marneffei ATCC 18224]KAE8551895.1 hypothetical protein EYB25_005786 [Talaromyces marneffei]QGA19232.1 hypothetical protein EYB26_006920 [Talaromyces marneffei]
MSHPYLISKIADPVFALIIGSTSAVLRIQRDMRHESAQSQTSSPPGITATTAPAKTEDVSLSKIAEIGARRVGRWWRGEFQGL